MDGKSPLARGSLEKQAAASVHDRLRIVGSL